PMGKRETPKRNEKIDLSGAGIYTILSQKFEDVGRQDRPPKPEWYRITCRSHVIAHIENVELLARAGGLECARSMKKGTLLDRNLTHCAQHHGFPAPSRQKLGRRRNRSVHELIRDQHHEGF